MIIIGEKLNSSIPSTVNAMQTENNDVILELAQKQVDNGANYIDINTAMLGELEEEKLKEYINLTKELNVGIMIDSVNMSIIKNLLELNISNPVIINSISLSTDVSPLENVDLSNVGVVAMPTSDEGIPETAEGRLVNVKILVDKLVALGFKEENIYADVLIETTAVNQASGLVALDTIKLIKNEMPQIKTTCGASNISFGLPNRKYINCSFISMAIYCGLDSLITDILNEDIKATICASNLLNNNDEYCMNYINNFR